MSDGMYAQTTETIDTALAHLRTHIGIFRCPHCRAAFTIDTGVATGGTVVRCSGCHAKYPVNNGVPSLFVAPPVRAGDVTDRMRTFYEETPFPNYEDLETTHDLIQKAEGGGFARALQEQIPFGVRVLEVGCGTGQLSNYLGLAHRHVFGVDMCRTSLGLAERFRTTHGIERVGFYQMNLFAPAFAPKSFRVVICNGVLHHTSDPFGGFRSIAELVEPGGYILIGLYNRFGRFVTDTRRVLFRLFGPKIAAFDPQLRICQSSGKWQAWYRDQYENPHESKHTIGEVLRWFQELGFEFQYGIPHPKLFHRFSSTERLFAPHDYGSAIERGIVQLASVVHGWREGGLFIMIGQRRMA